MATATQAAALPDTEPSSPLQVQPVTGWAWTKHKGYFELPPDCQEADEQAAWTLKIWHDNEGFLNNPATYRKMDLQMTRFPTNSGDLNPIENVWAKLRKDLAKMEFEDLQNGRVLTPHQFRLRASQLLTSYGRVQPGERLSFLQKLVVGMPRRLALCKLNKYGRCGK